MIARWRKGSELLRVHALTVEKTAPHLRAGAAHADGWQPPQVLAIPRWSSPSKSS